MTVPNPARQPGAPMQQPYPQASRPYPQQAAQPYPPPQQPYPTSPPPPRPPLTKAAAHRARLAGGVGGGLSWLGAQLALASAAMLVLSFLILSLLGTLVAALGEGMPGGFAPLSPSALEWLVPFTAPLVAGIVLGVLLLAAGLLISIRMLRAPGLAHPVGITFAGWGIALVAASVATGLASAITMPFSGMPMSGAPWAGQGPPVDLDDAFGTSQLLGWGIALVVGGVLISAAFHAAISVFTWWWMAHAMRPKAPAAA